jgi:hypothetical protein
MYDLSILAMFKNESMIIKDWIEHYLNEGVNHFYLIDNGSNDDYWNKIEKYKNNITLIKDPTRLEKNTQTFLYNKLFLETVKKETNWLIICDVDEYIYARNGHIKIMDVLNKLPKNVEKIWLPWKIFGSNNNINQPNGIIKSFIKRKIEYSNDKGFGKTICRTKNLNNIGCCGHLLTLNKNNIYYTANGNNLETFDFTTENYNKLDLHLNHYMLMSEEYYLKIKCKRGGGESGSTDKYTIAFFKNHDKYYNEIIDTELLNKIYKFEPLFSSNDKEMFYKYLNNSTYYLEYGNGGSTFQASIRNDIKKIISVESDIDWFNKLKEIISTPDEERFNFHYIDMKTLPNTWGYPGPNSNQNDWIKYSNIVKTLDNDLLSKLDLILIDGRFRVA